MRRHVGRLFGLMAAGSIAAAWLVAALPALAGDPCYHGFTIPAASTEAATEIDVAPCAFTPTVTHVAVGAPVTFRNGSDFAHLITGANQAWGSRDLELAPGSTVSYTFREAGVYPYACAIHRGMSGVVVVGDVASTTSGASAGGTSVAAGGLAVASALAGAVVGGSIVWLARRRRGTKADETVAGVV